MLPKIVVIPSFSSLSATIKYWVSKYARGSSCTLAMNGGGGDEARFRLRLKRTYPKSIRPIMTRCPYAWPRSQ